MNTILASQKQTHSTNYNKLGPKASRFSHMEKLSQNNFQIFLHAKAPCIDFLQNLKNFILGPYWTYFDQRTLKQTFSQKDH